MSKGKGNKHQASTASSNMDAQFASYLASNKLDVYSGKFAEEGVFSLEDFQLLTSEDITKIQGEVSGVGYQRRLRHAHDKSRGIKREEKDAESEPPASEFEGVEMGQQAPPQSRRGVKGSKRGQVQDEQASGAQRGKKKNMNTANANRVRERGQLQARRPKVDDDSPGLIIYLLVFCLCFVLVAAAVLLRDDLAQVSKQMGLHKKYPGRKIYNDMSKFFELYMKEHSDATCQLLHIAGTSIFLLMLLVNPSLILSVVTSICAGLVVKPFCNGFSSGIVEGLVAIFAGQLTAFSLNQWRKLMLMFVIGYGLAWIGHFVFEKNTPATFQAPSFSLMSDFFLFGNYVRNAVTAQTFPLPKALKLADCTITPEYFAPIIKNIQDLVPK